MPNESIHVVMIIQVYLPFVGGAERQLHSLVPLLRERNIKVSIVTRRYKGLKSFEVIDGVPVYRLPAFGGKVMAALLYSITSLPLLMYLRPDVMHAHELLSPSTTAIMAKPIVRKPIVAKILRGGKLGDLDKLKHKWSGLKRIATLHDNIDRFIAISKEIENELEEIDVHQDQYVFIPNGVDINKFSPVKEADKLELRRKLNLPANGTYVIFVGRLVQEKRVDLLIDLWAKIKLSHPDAYLLILGTGVLHDDYQKIAEDNVIFAGQVDNTYEYLKASDIFVLPSMTEGLSNSLLEAMSTGLASIATDVGGTPDVITHLESGYVIQPDNADELEEAVTTLMNDIALRKKIGTAARTFITENYAIEKTADKLNQLYRQLIRDYK